MSFFSCITGATVNNIVYVVSNVLNISEIVQWKQVMSLQETNDKN